MNNIEEDIKVLNYLLTFKGKGLEYALEKKHIEAIENILQGYEKQKQEKEKWKELYLEKLDETTDIILDYNKLKEKVKIADKIQELKENIHNILDKNGITRAYQIAIDEQFEKILKESEDK